MKKVLASMLIAVTAMSMIAEATARPLGGGRSIGRQSSNVSRAAPSPYHAPAQQQMQRPATPSATPAPAAPRPSSPWKGILGGALVGLGLGALASHFGLGGAIGSAFGSILMVLLLVLAAAFIFRMFKRKDTPANPAFSGFNQNPVPAGATPEIGSGLNKPAAFQPAQQPSASSYAQPPAQQWGVPGDFDSAAFLRQAKSSFIRMQAAWDKGDVNDLREFTTPEVFAELRMQIQERGATNDFTDVVSIDAELLGIETTGNDYLASVKFNGMIKPAADAPAQPFAEVWNMSKPLDGSTGWVLAGIQQLS
ncbi:MAG: Tim44 domain-containing protein [Gammaproteobacteria bacterium]